MNERNHNRTPWALVAFAIALLVGSNWPAAADTPAIREREAFDVPASSEANVITTSLTPATRAGVTDRSNPNVAYRMTVGITPGSADSILELRVTSGAVSFDYDFNSGTALTAGRLYTFTWGASDTYTYNLQCETATRVTYLVERVEDGGL